MSFFYLTPIKGDLPYHLLEVILFKRLDSLKALDKGEPAEYNEYIVEGSIYDNVGHFILCTIVILCENREFTNFFVRTELQLFKRRLANSSSYEIRLFSKKLLRQLRKHENVPIFAQSLQILCQHLILKDISQHITVEHGYNCTRHSISIYFKHCLTLVAKRQVELNNGIAKIPCGRWKQYLTSLFIENLQHRLVTTNLLTLRSDPRINEMLSKVKNNFSLVKVFSNILKSKDVDSASLSFPPCMLNLHQNLRQRHRLSHLQRFYYSLFLKDIGMPVDEALEFWKSEYRLHPNGQHPCCHNWEKDEKKYIYGIRHMYGLEGGRKQYSAMNCQRIQNADSSCNEGGCPFKSFEVSKMVPLLNKCSEPLLSQINEFKSKKLYTNACMLFMQENCTNLGAVNCDNPSFNFNFTPVKFYEMTSKCNKHKL